MGIVFADLLVGQFQHIWDRYSPDDYVVRVRGCASQKRDLVLLGGSPVAEGLSPSIIGNNVYNLGLPGGTTSDFYYAAIRGCPHAPKRMVYGMTASDINDSRGEPHGPHSLLTWSDLAEWVRTRPENTEWVIRHFLRGRIQRVSNLFQHRHAIRMWATITVDQFCPGCSPETLKEALEESKYAEGLISGNGYSPRGGFEYARFSDHKAAGTRGTRFDHLHYLHNFRTGSHLKYLLKLIAWCEDRGIDLLILDMPVTHDLERLYPQEFAFYRGILAELERNHRVPVLRPTRDALGLTDDHFADLIHMNRDGAGRLSSWLREHLQP